MSMISHQIDELRSEAKVWSKYNAESKKAKMLYLAADTIEALSEKVADQNLNRSEMPNSSDPISRQAVLDEIDDVSDVCEEIGQIEWCAELRTRVISLPSADRPTGKWDKNGNCTNCGEHAPYWAMATTYYRSNYCPNCGAEMKGETK